MTSSSYGLSLNDFHAYMPRHAYICVPTRELWPAASVNAKFPRLSVNGRDIRPSDWLDKYRSVEQMTWAPGEPTVIDDRLIVEGRWTERPGCTCFNLYRPPEVIPGEAAKANMWIKHLNYLYGPDAEHIINWLAHRVQSPQQKINHALVLGGFQGIGKDTLLEPVKYAIGPWNFAEVSPAQLVGRFNGHVKSVILRVSEARDLGDLNRCGFYEHMKIYTAAPPDVLRCDEKNIREYSVLNVCGVVMTTNHKTTGIYLPADDRRHFVAWSDLTKDDFADGYFQELWAWYEAGGHGHVGAYLRSLDISTFNPKAPPPKTQAFWAIADANRSPEDAELADALDRLGRPDATTRESIAVAAAEASPDFAEWIRNRNSRQIPHRMESVGYVPVRNQNAEDGLWMIGGRRQAVYARCDLTPRDQLGAAATLTRGDQ
jgi:hypothetical protein